MTVVKCITGWLGGVLSWFLCVLVFSWEIVPEVNSEDFELEPYFCTFALNMVCNYKQNWTWQR